MMKALVKAAEQQGWRVERTAKGCMFRPADRSLPQVLAHFTLSDHRGMLNLVAALRRSGLQLPR